jgi:hypothetical protein
MWNCPKCREEVDDELEVCWSCGTTIEGVEDPNFFDEPGKPRPQTAAGETPESLVTVAKTSLAGEAHAMRVRLEAEGIPVFLFDEFTVTMDWLLSNAIGGVKVQVPDHCLERAREILGIMAEEEEADTEQEDLEQEAGDSDEDTDPGESEDDQPPEEGIVDPERS